jgi:hypothetical protein
MKQSAFHETFSENYNAARKALKALSTNFLGNFKVGNYE